MLARVLTSLFALAFLRACETAESVTPNCFAAAVRDSIPASIAGRWASRLPLSTAGRPTCFPCFLARAMPARTRSAIRARSNCANEARMLSIRSPTGDVPDVSSQGSE